MYTMVLSITHRITGVLLSVGLLLFIYWLGALAGDAGRYATVRECMSAAWVKLVVLGFLFSFFYHLCNGIRHLTWDLGYCLERPQARATGWAVVIAAILLTAATAVWTLRVLGSGT